MWNLLSDRDENKTFFLHFIINGIHPLNAEFFRKKHIHNAKILRQLGTVANRMASNR